MSAMRFVGLQCRTGMLTLFVLALSQGLAFTPVRIAVLPDAGGVFFPCGDANRNGAREVYLTSSSTGDSLVVFEYVHGDSFRRINTPSRVHAPEAFGDADRDGRWEVSARKSQSVLVFEAPDSFSFPTDSVWGDDHPGVAGYFRSVFTDLDLDGRRELAARVEGSGIWIYENAGDNQFDSVAVLPGGTFGQFAVGDFDHDGLPEIVTGEQNWNLYVFEWTGIDNQYTLSAVCTTETFENYSVTAPGDLDGDGWPEIVFYGRVEQGDYPGKIMVYEATGHAQYRRVWEQPLQASFFTAKNLVSGDVDGDGSNEFAFTGGWVTLFKCIGPDQYQQIGQIDGSPGFVQLYDLNSDGRCEIIFNTGDHVSIYEDTTGLSPIAEYSRRAPLVQAQALPSVSRAGASILLTGTDPDAAIEVFGSDGRLVHNFRPAKCQGQQTWDLRDQNGRQVPAGTYLVVIRSKNQTQQLKLCVVR